MAMPNGVIKICKRQWYALGAFSNPRLFRKGKRGGWQYFRDTR